MLAIVAPGQGAQKPGFLRPWLADPKLENRLVWLSAVSGLDLIHYGTEADEETIKDTAVAQPLLVAAGLVTALSLFPHPADAFGKIGVGGGHSVGEITAAAASGILSAEQAMVFVRERGRGMAEASAVRPTSMAAVLRGNTDEVVARLQKHGLTPANYNGEGQIVAAGTVEQLEALSNDLPERVRMVRLSVAGAFHTEHMQPAVARLERLSAAVSTHDPRVRLLSNRDGQIVQSGADYLRRLISQVSSPVRWDLCMETMSDLGVTGLLELPPSGTLTGIAKRNMKGVEVFALNDPDQLDEARAFVDKHSKESTPSQISNTPSWRMVVSPGKGHFTRAPGIEPGVELAPGSPVGGVRNLREETPVITEHGGLVTEWLVEEADPVSPGQPLLRLHPAAETDHATEVDR